MGRFFVSPEWIVPASSTATTLYLCEGESEAEYVDYWLTQKDETPERIRVLCFKGLSHINEKISILAKEPGFGKVDRICVFLDAEQDYEARRASVRSMLARLDFPNSNINDVPWVETRDNKKACVFISPDSASPGRIEDIVLADLRSSQPEAYACISGFGECASNADLAQFDAKCKVASYLVLKKPGMSLGAAFKRGIFNQAHQAYALLNEVLEAALPEEA